MKIIGRGLAVSLVCSALLVLAMADADARGRSGGGRGHAAGARSHASGGHAVHRSSGAGRVARATIVVASPRWYYSPGYYYGYDPYYYPPAAYAPDGDVVYVEQPVPVPSAAAP